MFGLLLLWFLPSKVNAQYTMNDTCNTPFIHLEDSTNVQSFTLSDDGEQNITIPFNFTLVSATSNVLRVGNNGGVIVGSNGNVYASNDDLSSGISAPSIFPFWDDLYTSGTIYWDTLGTAPHRYVVIEWYQKNHISYTNGNITFEVILYESTNEIKFLYDDVVFGSVDYDYGKSATIGISDANGYYLQYSYNQPSLNGVTCIDFAPFNIDAKIISIVSPQELLPCSTDSEVDASIVYGSGGTDTLYNVNISYSFNGGAWVTETIDTILPFYQDTFTFATPLNISSPGSYPFVVAIHTNGDEMPTNDTMQINVIKTPVVSTFPYFQDFESTQYWTAWGNTTFELATPSTTSLNSAYSGQNAWVTNADSNYLNSEDGYVLSPCFDFSSLDTPVVSFAINYNTESCCDGAYLEVTLDEGNTWYTVGQNGDPDNWYNTSYNSWRGNSNGWVIAKHVLDTLGGKPSVRFRVVFTSDGSLSYEGFAFDNFRVYEKPAIDAIAQEIVSPVGDLGCSGAGVYNLKVLVASNGYDTIYNTALSYTLDGSTWTTETLDTLLPFHTDTFVFQNTLDLTTPGTYTITYAVSAVNDGDPTNDTISAQVVIPESFNTFPYLDNFENTTTWHSEGTTTFELGSPAGTNINSAYSGQNAWVTNLNGNYNNSENGYVVSPCFDFTSLDTPIVELAINYNTESCCDGAYLQVSTDEGNTWYTIGQTGDPNNWYNSSNSWRGNSNGWIIAKHQLDTLGGHPSVKFRVVFTSDGSINYEGFAFDDFRIYDKPHNDLIPLALLSPANFQCCMSANQPVTVSIYNEGTMSQDTFDISVSIDGGNTWTTETYLDTIFSGDTLVYTFNNTFDFSTPGIYNVLVAVNNSGDELTYNDTISVLITAPAPLSNLPYIETFDSLSGLDSSWRNVSVSSYGWLLNSGSTPTYSTGPDGDHTSGSGQYVYVEADNGNTGDKAALYSPCFNFTGNSFVKVSYWYHMYGNDITTLYFDVKYPSGWVTFDSIVGQQQNSSSDPWLQKIYVFPDSICQVRFITHKDDYLGDVSIDDFKVEQVPNYDLSLIQIINPVSGSCNHTAQDTVQIAVVNMGLQPATDFTLAYSIDSGATWITEIYNQSLAPAETLLYSFATPIDISANGDYYLISYVSEANDTISNNDTVAVNLHYFNVQAPFVENFETFSTTPTPGVLSNDWTIEPFTSGSYTWTVNSGPTSTSNTGPNGDHTTGNGIYIYTEASNGYSGDQTILTSPCIDVSNLHDTALVSFWYHMYGADINTLNVEYLNNNGEWVPLGSITGQQQTSSNDNWRMWIGYVPVNDFHKIRFVAMRGSSYEGDIAIDDINISQAASINLKAESITVPSPSCNLTNSEQISMTVVNLGTDTINGFNLAYSLDTGNTWTSEYVNYNLAPLETYTYSFSTGADFSNAGEYMVVGLAGAMGDTLNNDDTTYAYTMHIPVIDTFEYFVDFENGTSYWTTSGTGNWEFGTPTTDTAYSPVTCWATNLSGNYNNSEMAYLYTPCFDFSMLASPEMQFAINYNTESCCDYAYMEYSTDTGSTWQILGTSSDSAWYSTSSGWQGNSNGWVLAYHDLSMLAGQPHVQFRFVFYSDASVTYPGVLIDNFRIYQSQLPDLAVTYPENGSTISICSGFKNPVISVKNVGQVVVSAGTQFDINYQINSGTIHTNSVTLANDLIPGDSIIETFSDVYYFANNSTYNYKMYITFANDEYANDTVQGQYVVQNLQIDLGPDTIWTNQPDTIVLDAGGPYVTYSWSTGDSTQTLAISSYGTYAVTVTDYYGCEASDSVVVEMGVNNNMIEKGNVAVYPNPSHGLIVVRAQSGSIVEVSTANGKLVEKTEMKSTKENIDLTKFGKGVYLIKIVTENNVLVHKIVIN